MIPIFKDHKQQTGREKKPEKAHTGLWYDKFCDRWLDPGNSGNWKSENGNQSRRQWMGLGDEGKRKWIKTVEGPCGNSASIQEFALRQRRLVEKLGGRSQAYKTSGRFVTGLGRSHPVENGFAWHPTLGTPYLPGSSVKGLVRAYVEQWMEQRPQRETMDRIFGPRNTRAADTGSVIFLDAIPTDSVKLEADVMTPHYGPYYASASGEPPGDWHSPNPIPFLAVADGEGFQFALLPARAATDKELNLALEWLKSALETIGAGAKTAVGYGRFALNEVGEKKLVSAFIRQTEEEQKKAAFKEATEGKSSVFVDFLSQVRQNAWETKKEAFTKDGVIEGWLDRLENDPDPDTINALRKLVIQHFGNELLSNPDKKKGKKMDKPAFKERQIKIAHRINKLSPK